MTPDIETSEFADLTSFQRDLLTVISGMEIPKGLELKEELEDYYEDEIHHGRLYPNLDSLSDEGFINKIELDARSNGYTLTERGQKHLRARSEWEQQQISDFNGEPTTSTQVELDLEQTDSSPEGPETNTEPEIGQREDQETSATEDSVDEETDVDILEQIENDLNMLRDDVDQ